MLQHSNTSLSLQSHSHKHTGEHKHLHQKKLVANKQWKRYNNEKMGSKLGLKGSVRDSGTRPGSLTKDYHIKSVENYIGDSGKEFEGAAEQIVESYMGEYMQVREQKSRNPLLNAWYQD